VFRSQLRHVQTENASDEFWRYKRRDLVKTRGVRGDAARIGAVLGAFGIVPYIDGCLKQPTTIRLRDAMMKRSVGEFMTGPFRKPSVAWEPCSPHAIRIRILPRLGRGTLFCSPFAPLVGPMSDVELALAKFIEGASPTRPKVAFASGS